MDLNGLLSWLANDEDFAKLSYASQREVRTEYLMDLLPKDEDFMKLSPAAQHEVLNGLIMAPPALEDKILQQQAQGLVEAADRGDLASKKIMSNMVASSTMISNTMLVNLFGSKIIAPMIAAEKNVALTPELESSQFWAASPKDRLRLAEYFEQELSQDEKMRNRTRWLKLAAGTLPAMAEMLLLTIPTAGSSAAPLALGKLVTRGAVNAAVRATVSGSKLAKLGAGIWAGASHAVVTAGVGLVRSNVIDALNDVQNEGVAELLKKNAKWFAGYYLGDAFFNLALDTVWPMLRGTSLAFLPKGQFGASFKNVDLDTLTKVIRSYIAGTNIDPWLRERLPAVTQEVIDQMRKGYAVNVNFPSSSESDLFTFLANAMNYSVHQNLNDKTKIFLRELSTQQGLLEFDDVKAATAWLTNAYGTQGRARVYPGLAELRKDASIADVLAGERDLPAKLADGTPVTPANFTRAQWQDWTLARGAVLNEEARNVAGRAGRQLIEAQVGVSFSNREAFVQAAAKHLGLNFDEIDYVWDNGTKAVRSIAPVSKTSLAVATLGSTVPGKKYGLDFTGLAANYPELVEDLGPIVVMHEMEHIRDFSRSWRHLGKLSLLEEGPSAIHHAEWQNFDIDFVHMLAVKDAIRQGWTPPAAVLGEYPELVPYMLRSDILKEADLPAYTAATKGIQLQRVVKGRVPATKERQLRTLMELAHADPRTRTFDKDRIEQFVKEYARLTGSPEDEISRLRVEFVHSGAIQQEALTGVLPRPQILADKQILVRRAGRESYEESFRLPGGPVLDELDDLKALMDWIDARPGFPMSEQPKVVLEAWQIPKEAKPSLQKIPGTYGKRKVMLEMPGEGLVWTGGAIRKVNKQWKWYFPGRPSEGTAGEMPGAAVLEVLKKFQARRKGLYVGGKLQEVLELTPEGRLKPVSATSALRPDVEAGIVAQVLKGFPQKRLTATFAKTSKFLEKYPKYLAATRTFSPAWVKYATGQLLNGSLEWDAKLGKYVVGVHAELGNLASPVSHVLTFDSYDQLARHLVAQTVDEKYLRAYLADAGMTLRKERDTGRLLVFHGKEKLYEASSVEDLLVHNEELLPGAPQDLGPKLMIAVPGKELEVTYTQGGIAVGDVESLLKEAGSFDDRMLRLNKTRLAVSQKGYLTKSKLSSQVEVFIPETGDRRMFDTVGEATDFLKGGYLTLEELKKNARMKGMHLSVSAGRFVLWDSKNKLFMLDSVDSLKAKLAEVPVPEWMPEATVLPPELFEPFKKPPEGTFLPELIFPKEPDTPLKVQTDVLSQYWRAMEDWFVAHVGKGGDPEILKRVRNIEDIRQFIRGEDNKLGQIAHTVFSSYTSGKPGKLIPRARRVFLKEWLEAPEEHKAAVAALRQLSDDELRCAKQVRALWDDLFVKFQVGDEGAGRRFLENYIPHLSKYFSNNRMKHYSDGQLKKFLRDAFDGSPPQELDAFFLHARVHDALSVIAEDDPLTLLVRYGAIGHRQRYLRGFWKDTYDYLSGDTADHVGAARAFYYMNDVMGLPQGAAEKTLSDATLATLQKFGVEKGVGQDVLRLMMAFGYMSALGFRPMLAVRNTLQIWNTLAPVVGNKWVKWALNKVVKDPTGQIFDAARVKGFLMANLPVPGGETLAILDPEKFVGKFLNRSMRSYRSSDEFTRVVAYWAARGKFENASKLFRESLAGSLNMSEKTFLEESGLAAVDPQFRNQLLGYIRDGKWITAADAYAVKIVDWTMFPYRAATSPMAFRGVVGKLFGMMGHYPLYYVENIRRGLRYGSLTSKAAFVSTFLFNSLAIYESFKGLGMDAKDFLPWVPAQFSGGPYYQLMNQLVMSVGRGYKGRQARAELFGISTAGGSLKFNPLKGQLFQWMTPAGFELRKFYEGVQLAEAGDAWSAFLSMTGGTPTASWLSDVDVGSMLE